MSALLDCLLVLVLCSVFIVIVTVVTCAATFALQWLVNLVLDWWWQK